VVIATGSRAQTNGYRKMKIGLNNFGNGFRRHLTPFPLQSILTA
jgi:hypothetical protein